MYFEFALTDVFSSSFSGGKLYLAAISFDKELMVSITIN